MKIDVLYFNGCPSWQQGLENLKAALAAEKLDAEINLVSVESDADAAHLKFLGSPSFQINGEDLWPEERKTFALSCRVYATPGGMKGSPDTEMLRQKLKTLLADRPNPDVRAGDHFPARLSGIHGRADHDRPG
jgi:hypothetical protein